jgi:hypothetical protein
VVGYLTRVSDLRKDNPIISIIETDEFYNVSDGSRWSYSQLQEDRLGVDILLLATLGS